MNTRLLYFLTIVQVQPFMFESSSVENHMGNLVEIPVGDVVGEDVGEDVGLTDCQLEPLLGVA